MLPFTALASESHSTHLVVEELTWCSLVEASEIGAPGSAFWYSTGNSTHGDIALHEASASVPDCGGYIWGPCHCRMPPPQAQWDRHLGTLPEGRTLREVQGERGPRAMLFHFPSSGNQSCWHYSEIVHLKPLRDFTTTYRWEGLTSPQQQESRYNQSKLLHGLKKNPSHFANSEMII